MAGNMIKFLQRLSRAWAVKTFQEGLYMSEQVYTYSQFAPGLWVIEEKGVRCFLAEGPERAMLVDTGFGGGDLKQTVSQLTDKPVFVVNTHADMDHIGCNGQFGPALMHPAEFDRYHSGAKGAGLEALPLWEGHILNLGNWNFEVLLIPGHTPGSVALMDWKNRLLIGGDSVQAGNIFLFGPGRNLPAYLASLEKLAALEKQIDTVLPSHGPLPLKGGCLPALLQAARDLQAGRLEGRQPDRDLPALLYQTPAAGFYYGRR